MTGFVHGSKAGVRLGTAAAPTTKVDVSQYFNSDSFPQIRDTAETTTFGKLSKTYIPGLRDATLSGEGKYATAIDTQLSALFTTDALIGFDYAPAGLGVTGTPLYSGLLFVTNYEISSDVGDATTFSAEFQVSGDVARTIQ